MNNEKEIRAFNFEMKADNNEQYGDFVEGRAIVYNSVYDNGYWNEYIDEGALDNCDMKDVRLLVNHNTDMIPLARSRNNTANSTMQLTADSEGLKIRANLDTENNATAKALYSATGRGDVSGMSFMFVVDKDSWEDVDTEKPTRHILSIRRIYEVSAVTFPAYEATTFECKDALAVESAKTTLENVRAEARAKKEAEDAKKLEKERQLQRIRILASL